MTSVDLTILAKIDEGAVGDAKARRLIAWFNRGADGQIPWGSPGDFDACVRIAADHMPLGKAKGFCANRHHDATGEWPGPHAHGASSHKSDRSTPMTSLAYGWAPITKVEDQPDGTVIVHGPMTSADLDRDMQRFSQEFLDRAVPQWFSESGNIREQHDPKRAVGNALMVKRDDSGVWNCAAHVVDPVAVTKVRNRVLKGFSIGVKNPHITYGKADAPAGEIDDGLIVENSLVDRPSNPTSLFQIVKADGDDAEHVVFEPGDGLIERDDDPDNEPAQTVDAPGGPEGEPVAEPAGDEETVTADDEPAEKSDDPDLVKDIRHAPAGSPQGGQFMPGGTDAPSGVDANRKGAEKVKVTAAGKAGGAKGSGGGKAKTSGKASATQMPAVMQAMSVLGIKTGPNGMSDTDAVKAVQKKLNMPVDGKVSPDLMARVHQLLSQHHAEQAKAQRDQKKAEADAKRAERAQAAADRKQAAEKARQDKANAKVAAAEAKRTAHKADDPNGDTMADDEPDLGKAVTADQRKEYADSGVAMPNGDFPIPDEDHLRAAVGRLGNYTGDKAAAKKHIVKRARALNAVSALPDDWGVSKADDILEQLDELGMWQGTDEVVKYDEADDIKGAQQAIAAVAALIQSEAEELALGRMEEARDIEILLRAVDALQWFLCREQEQADQPDLRDLPDDDPDGTPDVVDVVDAVKADTPAATDDGPADTADTDTPQLAKTSGTQPETPQYLTKTDIADLVKAAVEAAKAEIAEARKADEERIKALEADLAKALDMPQPGGPVLTRTAAQQAAARNTDADRIRAEAQALIEKANSLTHEDSTLAAGYRERAQALLAKADA